MVPPNPGRSGERFPGPVLRGGQKPTGDSRPFPELPGNPLLVTEGSDRVATAGMSAQREPVDREPIAIL